MVGKVEYAQLLADLADPGGTGWRDDNVDEALADRLRDCRERYIEILNEMMDVVARLCKATRVDDAHFQDSVTNSQGVSFCYMPVFGST